jgi:hypothetical protein
MKKLDILEILYRMVAISAIVLMVIVVLFGWLKGFFWEKNDRLKKRHKY